MMKTKKGQTCRCPFFIYPNQVHEISHLVSETKLIHILGKISPIKLNSIVNNR